MNWKTIEALPSYEVSDDGQVRNKATKKILSQHEDRDGYFKVWLSGGRKGLVYPKFIHRLVAEAFVTGYFEGAQVNHIDENKKNNAPSNLEWCTCKQNINHGTRTQRAIAHCKKPVEQIKNGTVVARYDSTHDAQRATGIWQQNISKCCNKRPTFKTAGGYEWRYAK